MPTVIDELVRKSAAAVFDFDYGSPPIKLRLPVAVLTCMDARLSTDHVRGFAIPAPSRGGRRPSTSSWAPAPS